MADGLTDEQFTHLARKVVPQSRLLRTWALKGGISSEMAAFEIEFAGRQTRKLIVRRPGLSSIQQNPQAVKEEFKLLQLTTSWGIPTPTPVHFEPAGPLFSTAYIVLDYIEGTPEFSPTSVAAKIRQMATYLAQIHHIDSGQPELSFLPQHATLMDNFLAERPATLDLSLSEGRIRETLESAWPFPNPNPSVLLHGDFWPGNLLWNQGTLIGVIDWEEAALGDPMADLAISQLDILWLYGVDAMRDFTHHYQSLTTFNFAELPYWELYAALRPASRIGEWATAYPSLGRPDITEQTMRNRHHIFITQAFERLSAR